MRIGKVKPVLTLGMMQLNMLKIFLLCAMLNGVSSAQILRLGIQDDAQN